MGTAMAVGGCWPAIDTADAAMELMVAGQAMEKATLVSGCWPATATAMMIC